MKISGSHKQFSSLLLVVLLLVAPATAQQKQPTPPSTGSAAGAQQTGQKEEEATFDTLLAAGSYKVYGEARMIGQLARSNYMTELLEPTRLLGAPPKEVTGIIEFLNANAEALATSRVMFAAIPARPSLPPVFVAVELASVQDALKLEPKLRAFFSSFSASTPGASTAPAGAGKSETKIQTVAPKQQADKAPASRPVFVKRAGSLILMSDTSFTLKNLRPDGSHPLAADPNFQKARNRFASEALFVYYDVNLAPHVKGTIGAAPKQSDLAVEPPAQAGKSPAQADKTVKPSTETPLPVPESSETAPEVSPPPGVIAADPVIVPDDKVGGELKQERPVQPAKGAQPSPNISTLLPMLGGLFGGDEANWPEAVGVGVALEADEVIIRATLINAPNTPNTLIPFFPFLVPGPEIAPRAAALSPADTDLFVSISLDLPRIYDAFLKTIKDSRKSGAYSPEQENESAALENQIALFELALGFRIKEDLLGALGNEVAINVPFDSFKFGPNTEVQTATGKSSEPASQPGFAVFISLNDKDRVQEMLPRVLEVIGLKATGVTGQTEKRGPVEITNYGAVALAFIDDFLVISKDMAALRAVADARENNQTLSANAAFKSSTAWQSSRVLGQVYLSNAFTTTQQSFVQLDDKLQDFLTRFDPQPGAITHAAFNDASGLFHELHLPKDWVALMMAGTTSRGTLAPMADNEMRTVSVLMSIRGAQTSYKEGKGKGSYATRDQLIGEKLIPKRLLEMEGYRIEITATGEKFEVSATPTEYGRTGRQSFYLDETGIIRGADHNGQPATVADKPL
jgi:hypothetical protein